MPDFPIDRMMEKMVGKENSEKAISALTTGENPDSVMPIVEEQKDILHKIITNFFDKRDLARQLLDIVPMYYDQYRMWWIWCKQDFRWKITDETDIMNVVCRLSQANTISSKEKNEILESLKQESRLRKPKEIEPTWIQFRDKIFDIKTGEEFKATPMYFVTNPTPYQLHQEKFRETPKMDEIFEQWVGKDHVKTLYEILAYCLIPDYPIHRIFCFMGEGMNGKSKFLELLRKFIGKDNCCSTELDTLLQSRFEVTRLHKKLVCQMGETNFNEMSKTSTLKKLSGGDLIGFEYKNKDPFEDQNYAKILIATNNLPSTTDKTIGFYRRWMIIDFPNRFSEKKDILGEIPEEEYEALAVKCTMILKDLLDVREFTNEGSVEERMKRYEDRSNPLQTFWNEMVEEEVNSHIFKYDFKDTLKEWCTNNRFREISDKAIASLMKENSIITTQRKVEWVSKEGTRPHVRAWGGIKWKGAKQV